jgi:hypothetical protein
MNKHADWVRYVDRSTYTGAPLPEPTSCPSISGLTLCGGSCGTCPNGYQCIGRSPLHPYSLCINPYEMSFLYICQRGKTCGSGRRCLTFVVDDAAQAYADAHSFCVDASTCDTAAKSYPGGALCGP